MADAVGARSVIAQPRKIIKYVRELGDKSLRASHRRWNSQPMVRSDGPQASLSEQLQKLLVVCEPNGLKFAPEEELFGLIKVERVERELQLLRQHRSVRRYFHTQMRLADPHRIAVNICGEQSARGVSIYGTVPEDWADALRGTERGTSSGTSRHRKIFAILILIGRAHKIESFLLDDDVSDADLPLVRRSESQSIVPHGGREGFTPARCFKSWRKDDIDEFLEKQWIVLPRKFPISGTTTQTDVTRWILPFTTKCNIPGGGGEVSQVKIHPQYHDFDGNPDTSTFALKKTDAKREVDIVNRFRSGKHAHHHIIRLLDMWTASGSYFMLFPMAKYDLLAMWMDDNNTCFMDRTVASAEWVLDQCRGLADALSTIHRYRTFDGTCLLPLSSWSTRQEVDQKAECGDQIAPPTESLYELFGRHADIKPSNIVWFPPCRRHSHGLLQLTDFGLTHFSTREGVPKETLESKGFTFDYRAPECTRPDWVARPSADIWSLGCVFLEFITWFRTGKDGLEAFGRRRGVLARKTPDSRGNETEASQDEPRPFFSTIDGETYCSAVEEQIEKLRMDIQSDDIDVNQKAISAMLMAFLALIEQSMLLMLPHGAENSARGRKSARQIAEAFHSWHRAGEDSRTSVSSFEDDSSILAMSRKCPS